VTKRDIALMITRDKVLVLEKRMAHQETTLERLIRPAASVPLAAHSRLINELANKATVRRFLKDTGLRIFADVQSSPSHEQLQVGMLETAKLGVRQGHHGGKHAAAAARYVKVVEFLSTNPYAQGRGIKVALRSTYTQIVRHMMANGVRELFLNLIDVSAASSSRPVRTTRRRSRGKKLRKGRLSTLLMKRWLKYLLFLRCS